MDGPDHDLPAIREALRLRRGGRACPFRWDASHSWFTLRIEKPGLAGNLHLLCGDCERVEFENRIFDVDIQVEEIESGGRTRGGWASTARYRVRDRDRLLIECGDLRLEFNVPPVFGLA